MVKCPFEVKCHKVIYPPSHFMYNFFACVSRKSGLNYCQSRQPVTFCSCWQCGIESTHILFSVNSYYPCTPVNQHTLTLCTSDNETQMSVSSGQHHMFVILPSRPYPEMVEEAALTFCPLLSITYI